MPDARGFLERLPKWAIVIPLALHWLLLSLRHRAAALPSCANPSITAGGLVGEGKTEYFASMGAHARSLTAPHGSLVVQRGREATDAAACITRARLAFPLIAKPDLGWCGFGVRRINRFDELEDYLAAFPAGERALLQAYVPHAGEAGVFWVREPGAARGRILSLALREYPRVHGDGLRTIDQLMAADPRLQRLTQDPLHRLELDRQRVPAAGERVRLCTIGSTRVGSVYRNGARLITPALSAAFEAIATDLQEFHFGRFDIRYASEEALRAGKGFQIIEVNGAGSEAIEAWDPDTAPLQALATLLRKQALLFRIAAANRRRGYAPIGMLTLARLWRRQLQLIPRYPPSN